MTAQRLLSKQGDFEDLVGTTLFESDPVLISKQRIQDYCTSLGQMDWFHFDEVRCAESEFGAIVAPGTLTFALIHATFFQHVHNAVQAEGLLVLNYKRTDEEALLRLLRQVRAHFSASAVLGFQDHLNMLVFAFPQHHEHDALSAQSI